MLMAWKNVSTYQYIHLHKILSFVIPKIHRPSDSADNFTIFTCTQADLRLSSIDHPVFGGHTVGKMVANQHDYIIRGLQMTDIDLVSRL